MCNNRLIVTTFQPFSPTLRRRNDVKLLCRLFLLDDSAPCTLLHNIAQYRTLSHNIAQCRVVFSPHWWSLAAGDASNKALGLLSAFCITSLVQIDVCTRTLDHLRRRPFSLPVSRWSLAHVVLAHVSFAFFSTAVSRVLPTLWRVVHRAWRLLTMVTSRLS